MHVAWAAVIVSGAISANSHQIVHNPEGTNLKERVVAHLKAGEATRAPEDAKLAATEGEFGLIQTGHRRFQPTGLTCFTPYGQSPLTLTQYGHGDYITPNVGARIRYSAEYNRALIEQPGYPYLDLCRVWKPQDDLPFEDPKRVTVAAAKVTGPPRDLFEAARRGNARDILHFLDRESLEAFDGVGMTALSWAVARQNRAAIDALLKAGANPWLGGPNGDYITTSAVYWAAALGRQEDFKRLAKRPGRTEDSWSSWYLAAAMNGNDPAIFRHMLAEPHERFRKEFVRRPLPDRAMFQLMLDEWPELATDTLFQALPEYSESRVDLVRLSLQRGADPNAVKSYSTPLARVATGLTDSSIEIIDILVKAGADPNLISHRERPVWIAFRAMKYDESGQHWKRTGRPKRAFDRLVGLGADLRLPNWQGVPPIWFLLFPRSYDRTEFDPSSITPELLEMLIRKGIDVNAEWKGRRVLTSIEEQAGRDSAWSKILKRHGAKP